MNSTTLSKHDQSVAFYARDLIGKGYKPVYSHLAGNIQPPTIGGRIPDVYGRYGLIEVVIEVETADSLGQPHTKAQHAVFRLWAAQARNRQFFVRIA